MVKKAILFNVIPAYITLDAGFRTAYLTPPFPFQGFRTGGPTPEGQQVHHADVHGKPRHVQTPPDPRHHRGPADEGSGPSGEAAEEDGEVSHRWRPRFRLWASGLTRLLRSGTGWKTRRGGGRPSRGRRPTWRRRRGN